MLILTIRTDKPESEIGLYQDDKQLVYVIWEAHRQLAETLHTKIKEILETQRKDWHDLEGIAVYPGPGSFTGLRIGLSVANALADSLQIPVVGQGGEAWQNQANQKLLKGEDQRQVMPEYGADVHITPQRK